MVILLSFSCFQFYLPFFSGFNSLYHSFPNFSWLNFIFSFYLSSVVLAALLLVLVYLCTFVLEKKVIFDFFTTMEIGQSIIFTWCRFSSMLFLPSFYYQVYFFQYLFFPHRSHAAFSFAYCSSLNEASIYSEVITKSVWSLTVVRPDYNTPDLKYIFDRKYVEDLS